MGCNDVRFRLRLKDQSWNDLSGPESTGDASAEASRKGFAVFDQSLNSRAVSALVDKYGYWDCVVLRQALEHIRDLSGFGSALNDLLREEGLPVIEVLDSRVNFRSLDYALWEEHVNCFTPQSLDRFLALRGFRTIHSYTSTFSGVCLTVIAKKVAQTRDRLISAPK